MDAFELRMVAESLKDIMVECWFLFTPNFIRMTNVDPEKVIMAEYYVNMPSDKYSCTSEFRFPIYIHTLYRLLRTAKRGETVILQSNEDQTFMYISVFKATGHLKTQSRLYPLTTTPDLTIHNAIIYKDCFSIPTMDLYQVVHEMVNFSRHVTFEVYEGMLNIHCQDEMKTFLRSSLPGADIDGPWEGTFLGRYIEKFCKSNLRKNVVLRVEQNCPMTISYELEYGHLSMSIASLA